MVVFFFFFFLFDRVTEKSIKYDPGTGQVLVFRSIEGSWNFSFVRIANPVSIAVIRLDFPISRLKMEAGEEKRGRNPRRDAS